MHHAMHHRTGRCGPMTGRRRQHHWGGPGFGPGGPRARRGDVRAAILALLAEEPRNGYQVIQEIAERTQGLWKPSPGAVYPALAVLTDEGLVREIDVDGKRAFELSEDGRAHVEQHDLGRPWEAVTEGVPEGELALHQQIRPLVMAVVQVVKAGTPEQIEEAKRIVEDARRALYGVLAG
jgi:DNA-binding PadR family transcriptional regulator